MVGADSLGRAGDEAFGDWTGVGFDDGAGLAVGLGKVADVLEGEMGGEVQE